MSAEQRTAVALKIDEAPLVINRGFAQTMALKRSAGLETVACWQTDAQWTDPEGRPQLDALFAHRVYFATASSEDARAATDLMMAAYSDQVRGLDHGLPILGSPDVRLHLPKHYALASWVTAEGRQPTFIAQTFAVEIDAQRIAWHDRRQHERGGRELESFRQPHWDRGDDQGEDTPAGTPQSDLATGDAAAGPARATHRSDPTGERERDDFAELRELLRSEATRRTPTARSREAPDAGREAPELAPAATVGQPSTREPPASYAELVAVDEATRVTWPRKTERRAVTPDVIDLELLGWLTELRFALATQIHRRFGGGKSYSTTQRRLKKLSSAGWVQRFQFFATAAPAQR